MLESFNPIVSDKLEWLNQIDIIFCYSLANGIDIASFNLVYDRYSTIVALLFAWVVR